MVTLGLLAQLYLLSKIPTTGGYTVESITHYNLGNGLKHSPCLALQVITIHVCTDLVVVFQVFLNFQLEHSCALTT